MEKNEIKKLLYKQNPTANLLYLRKGKAYYECEVYTVGYERRDEEYYAVAPFEVETLNFEVPIEDMGDADYFVEMPAKLLIRYLL